MNDQTQKHRDIVVNDKSYNIITDNTGLSTITIIWDECYDTEIASFCGIKKNYFIEAYLRGYQNGVNIGRRDGVIDLQCKLKKLLGV